MKVRVKLLIILCVFVTYLEAQGFDDDGNEVLEQVEHFEGFYVPENYDVKEDEVKSTKSKAVEDQIIANNKLDLGKDDKNHHNVSSENSSVTQSSTEKPVQNKSEILAVNLDVRNEINLEDPNIELESAEIVDNPIKSNNSSIEPGLKENSTTALRSPVPAVIPVLLKNNLSEPETTVQTTTTMKTTEITTITKLQTTFSEHVIHLDPATLAPITFKTKSQNPHIPDSCSEFKVIKHLSINIDNTDYNNTKSHLQMMSQYYKNFS